MPDQIRTFNTGATRNALEGKLSYMRALSPAVLRRYVEYLASHRKQADGNLREFDNWKKGIPQDAYCDSLMRHAIDAWARLLGLPSSDGTGIEDLLCAVIFNANGWLFEILTAKSGNREAIGNGPVNSPTPAPPTCGDCLHSHYGGNCYRFPLTDKADPQCFVPSKE